MKNFILIVILAINIVICYSQKEYLHIINSNCVEFNFNTKDLKPNIKNKSNLYNICYNSDLANLNSPTHKFTFQTSYIGTVCDKNGDLLLYSDGRHIFDSDDKLIYQNDKNINMDIFTRTTSYSYVERYLTDSGGAVSVQILKKPGCNDEYYLFYTTHNYVLNKYWKKMRADTLTYTEGYSLYYYNKDI